MIIPFSNPNRYWESIALTLLHKRYQKESLLKVKETKDFDVDDFDPNIEKRDKQKQLSHQIDMINHDVSYTSKEKKKNKLSELFKGQSRAIEKLDKELSNQLGDFAFNDGSPMVIALMGPSGVGKTELSRQVVFLND